MKWCVKYYHPGARVAAGHAILPPHNTREKIWYDDINKAHAHRDAHQKHHSNYIFKVEEYYD